ncbi:hypothetical protein G6M86_20950 [Agrobacterium tumefaciens]|uniref:Uncharacterized protein n=1 Tax=Agrobacterium tumefaciens TaxID=358 RepID=A0AAJ4N6Q6_AGRTU|nr:hypothetical protein G6M86_20950 [Agrobacterium tumefaciens]
MGPSANYKKKIKTAEEIAAEEEFNRRLIEADNQLKGITADPNAPLNATPIQPRETPEDLIRQATLKGNIGGFEYPIEAPKVDIDPNSPFSKILGNQAPPMEDPRVVETRNVAEGDERPMAPTQGPMRPSVVDPTTTSAVPNTAPAPATAPVEESKLGPISGIFAKLGADTDDKRSALGTSLIKMGASMMQPNGMNFMGSLGQGLADATTSYDETIKQQRDALKDQNALNRQKRVDDADAKKLAADEEIARIYQAANGQPLSATDKQRVASLLTQSGRFDDAQKVLGISGSTADRYSKVDRVYDPKTGKSYDGFFDKQTGQTVYRDPTTGEQVTTDNLQVDSANRGKANMSDPITKESRTQEVGIINAGNKATRNITDIDTMEEFADNVGGEGYWGMPSTGAFNEMALKLERSGLVPEGMIKEKGARGMVDWMAQKQLGEQVESMRGLGPMSDKDLEMLKRRILNGNMSPEEFKLVASKMRQHSRYAQKVAGDWREYKSNNPGALYMDWIGDYDANNYANFMNDRSTGLPTKAYEAARTEQSQQSNGMQKGAVITSNGRRMRFLGGDPKSPSSWEEVK